jgi:Protein of unknown function (DUF3352)
MNFIENSIAQSKAKLLPLLTLRNSGLLLVFFAFAMAFAQYAGCYRLPFCNASAWEGVPSSAAFVLRFAPYTSAKNILNTTPYSGLQSWKTAEKIQRDAAFLEQIFAQSNVKKTMSEQPMLAVALVSKAKDFDYLYLWEKTPINLAAIAQSPSKHAYKGCDIYEYHWENNDMISFALYKGVCLASKEAFLVEYGIDQLNSFGTALPQQKGFAEAKKQMESKPLAIYMQMPQLPALANIWLQPNQYNRFQSATPAINWLVYTPDLDNYGLKLKGLAFANSPFTRFFDGKIAQTDSRLSTVLPNNTAFYAQFQVGDFSDFQDNTGKSIDFTRYFSKMIANSFAYILTEPATSDFTNNHILCFKANDAAELDKKLNEYAQEQKGTIAQYQNFKIRHLPVADFSKNLLGEGWDMLTEPYFVVIGDYVLFANSEQTIEVLIDKYNFNQTLASEPVFLDFWTHSITQTNAFGYLKPSRAFHILKKWIKTDSDAEYQNLYNQWCIFNQISLSATENGGFLTINALLQPSGNAAPQVIAAAETNTARTSVVWKTELKAAARSAPFVLKNPSNGEQEIMVQDVQNLLYLIDRSGNILWTRQLEEPVLSGFFQVDMFNNKNLQYLFNTKNKIYCIDRSSKDVTNYPIPLGSPATNGLTCVDYDGEHEYFYYLACANGNWYGFQKGGRPVGGWNPLALEGSFNVPLQRIKANNMDYLLARTAKGTIYAYNKYGTPYFPPVVLSDPSLSACGFDPLSDPLKISSIDTSGILNVITLDGKKTFANLRVGNQRNVRSAIIDTEGDPLKEYAIISQKQLSVYGYRQKSLTKWWGADFDDELSDVFGVKLWRNPKQNIALLSKTKKHLYLLDEDGVLYPNFPINATTRCIITDFFGKGSDVLVGACDNIVYTYTLE